MWPWNSNKQPIDLLAAHKTTGANDLVFDGKAWRSTGLDPYITYQLDDAANRGALAVELDVEILEGRINPRLYFHRRKGFSEQASELMRRIGVGHYRLYVYLPRSCRMLRFDPAETSCTFRIRRFTVTPVSYMTFAKRAMRGGANQGEAPLQYKRLLGAARRALRHGVAFERASGGEGALDAEALYEKWMTACDYTDHDRPIIAARIKKTRRQPKISVLMPVYNAPTDVLNAAIQSVAGQIYGNWELCIANDASTAEWIKPLLDEWVKKDSRIKVVHRPNNGHIAEATNSAFELATADYIALLDHDDILRPHALAEVALALARRPDAELIYSDEDKIRNGGQRYDPFFKPEWSPDLFLSQNYLNHLTVHRGKNIIKAGGWRKEYTGSQDYDLNLRVVSFIKPERIVHIPKILYHWRSTADSMAMDEGSKNYAVTNAVKALNDHIKTNKIDAAVERIIDTNWYRVKHGLPKRPPLVSLIIPTRNGFDILKTCIDSIREKTTYKNYEILIVDNGSDDRLTIDYLKSLRKKKVVRVLSYPHPFNYSAINNFAVKQAKGAVIGLINNDIEVISPDWLGEMVALALRPGTGCVGAKLYYPNNTIQHAGVIVGLGGVAGHSHKRFARGSRGYFGRLLVVHNVTAVTGACLVIQKKIYQEAGGLDEKNLKIAFNDVDFCLKVQQLGYLNVWTPFAELYHHESVSRGVEDDPVKKARFMSEIQFMKRKWGETLAQDRFYSPNLTRKYEDFSINLE